MDMIFDKKLPIPVACKAENRIGDAESHLLKKKISDISDVLSGKSNKKLLVIGPCSADKESPVLDYACRLSSLSEKVDDIFVIVMRVYTAKPRTNGFGYKGMVHNPSPNGPSDPFDGVIAARRLHIKVISETGVPTADEMLYPQLFRYFDDILAYAAVGARSVEDQEHRLVASGAGIPIGMKNPTGGNLSAMINGIKAAQSGHSFIYRGWAVESNGNQFAHAILRGYQGMNGMMYPNYQRDCLAEVGMLLNDNGIVNPSVIIDTNHCNSSKDPFKQPGVAFDVVESIELDSRIDSVVKGFMIESYLEDGSGNGAVYGQSITDPCLGWGGTEKLVLSLADKLA